VVVAAATRAEGRSEVRPAAQEGDAGWIGQEGESGARRQNRPVREAEGAQGLSMPERSQLTHSRRAEVQSPRPRSEESKWTASSKIAGNPSMRPLPARSTASRLGQWKGVLTMTYVDASSPTKRAGSALSASLVLGTFDPPRASSQVRYCTVDSHTHSSPAHASMVHWRKREKESVEQGPRTSRWKFGIRRGSTPAAVKYGR
jgi:hypothetical protein